MNKSLSKVIFAIIALGLTMPAFAKIPLYEMERNQKYRIQEGIYSGELSVREARALYQEQHNIRRLKKRFLRDGRLSKREKRTLRQRYRKAGHNIYQLKHNYRKRYFYSYYPFSSWYHGGRGVFGFMFSQRY